ncbi:transposase-related [Anaeramoeba flamelloides]|uniref:Transposase-related n=2 Tax=Anaeramoeba flamelloides TaxID=1746091 RepID=A0ABQ8YNL3_9EUKA|nr:transposase-related [Anaeramoeba flamelloides]
MLNPTDEKKSKKKFLPIQCSPLISKKKVQPPTSLFSNSEQNKQNFNKNSTWSPILPGVNEHPINSLSNINKTINQKISTPMPKSLNNLSSGMLLNKSNEHERKRHSIVNDRYLFDKNDTSSSKEKEKPDLIKEKCSQKESDILQNKKRKRYTRQFKYNTLLKKKELNLTYNKISNETGVSSDTLRKWPAQLSQFKYPYNIQVLNKLGNTELISWLIRHWQPKKNTNNEFPEITEPLNSRSIRTYVNILLLEERYRSGDATTVSRSTVRGYTRRLGLSFIEIKNKKPSARTEKDNLINKRNYFDDLNLKIKTFGLTADRVWCMDEKNCDYNACPKQTLVPRTYLKDQIKSVKAFKEHFFENITLTKPVQIQPKKVVSDTIVACIRADGARIPPMIIENRQGYISRTSNICNRQKIGGMNQTFMLDWLNYFKQFVKMNDILILDNLGSHTYGILQLQNIHQKYSNTSTIPLFSSIKKKIKKNEKIEICDDDDDDDDSDSDFSKNNFLIFDKTRDLNYSNNNLVFDLNRQSKIVSKQFEEYNNQVISKQHNYDENTVNPFGFLNNNQKMITKKNNIFENIEKIQEFEGTPAIHNLSNTNDLNLRQSIVSRNQENYLKVSNALEPISDNYFIDINKKNPKIKEKEKIIDNTINQITMSENIKNKNKKSIPNQKSSCFSEGDENKKVENAIFGFEDNYLKKFEDILIKPTILYEDDFKTMKITEIKRNLLGADIAYGKRDIPSIDDQEDEIKVISPKKTNKVN